MSFAWETAWYLAGSTLVAGLIFAVALVAGSPAVLWLGSGLYLTFFARTAELFGIVILCGVPANWLFVVFLRDHYYVAADPIVDWMPWVPSGDWILDRACGGRYLDGATVGTIRAAWALFAIPTWTASIALWRLVVWP